MKLPTASSISAFLFGVSKKHVEVHEKIDNTLEEVCTQQAINCAHIEDHTKRLDIGAQDFKDIRKSIAGIDTSLAVLAEKAEQRRKDHKDEG